MAPYIHKQIKLSRERVEVKLERELITQLERYCEYLESDRDYVIAQALAIAFRKDKGFRAWLLKNPAPLATPQVGDVAAAPTTKS
jgi:hypothetical protein